MSTPTPTNPAPGGPGGKARLGNGELRRQVAEFLAAQSADEFTPGAVARALAAGTGVAKSSGAVANALAALAQTGAARQTSTSPARYRATATTATVAALTTPTRPGRRASASRTSPGNAAATPGTTPAAPVPTKAARTKAGTVKAGPAPVRGPVKRPNGTLYHPRQVEGAGGLADVTALRKLRDAGVPALLYGPPGTGKTSVVEAAFGDLITVAGDADTTVADLVGEYTQPEPGRYVFVDGPLVVAMREGRALFVDDATLIPPTVLAVLYPAMDGRREVTVKADGGRRVTAAEGFYVVAGHNPGVHGAVLSDALSSRFSAQIKVSTDYDLADALGIDRRAVRAARNLAAKHANGEVGWAPQLRELIAFARIATALGIAAAFGNLIGQAPEEDRDVVASVVTSAFGQTVAPLALGRQI
jgi:nitric oxide reductase NorQ protein